ncbi:hypothetical protein Hanom_Chr12g01114751 [Helianthus anomalus]
METLWLDPVATQHEQPRSTQLPIPPSASHLSPDQQVFLSLMKTLWIDPVATQHEQPRSTQP